MTLTRISNSPHEVGEVERFRDRAREQAFRLGYEHARDSLPSHATDFVDYRGSYVAGYARALEDATPVIQVGPEVQKATRLLHVAAALDQAGLETWCIDYSSTDNLVNLQFPTRDDFLGALTVFGLRVTSDRSHVNASADGTWQGIRIHGYTGHAMLLKGLPDVSLNVEVQ
jgi:hypothetical protein